MAVYRLPFPSETNQSTWVTSGNWDVGGAHGPGGSDDHADGQSYAFDIGHVTGGKVLAARAGFVFDLETTVPDNTNPVGKGAGNYIWIRHADSTMAAYCHLQHNSLRVVNGQWVPQGYWIADSGATGNTIPQPNPHLHFEVRTYAEAGVFTVPTFGTSLLIHFEDKTRALFRPANGEALSGKSNNVEGDYRQDHWRHCGKCRALYFAGNPGSVCPEGGEHAHGGGGNYTLSVDPTKPQGQSHWRYCTKCHALFFGDGANSRCPKGPGSSHVSGGSNYVLREYPNGVGQNGWRWCKNCAVLWFNASGSKCPATGSTHSLQGSGDYQLHATAEDWQRNLRACGKCGCLFLGDNIAVSKCAGNGGGSHVVAKGTLPYTPNYFLQSGEPPDAPGQKGWRWCSKCQCLWMGLNSGSDCAGGAGGHSKLNSGNYAVIESTVQAPGQAGWRWCNKCQSLWFAPFGAAMKCPATGSHSQTGGSYWVQFFGHA